MSQIRQQWNLDIPQASLASWCVNPGKENSVFFVLSLINMYCLSLLPLYFPHD